MESAEILQIYNNLTKKADKAIFTTPFSTNPLVQTTKRPNSVSIEDGFFGDSGKGRVTAEFNTLLGKRKKLISFRYNGGANAGHECAIDGKVIVTHQLPIGIIQENTTAIIGRGALLHPQDLLSEIEDIKNHFGGKLPGKLLIDERVILGLDTHRAMETAVNSITTGGHGSTGRGISPGYASFYERIAVSLKDLLSENWEDIFAKHYQLYENFTKGFGENFSLSDIEVVTLHKGKRRLGSQKAFLQELRSVRGELAVYSSQTIAAFLNTSWPDPKISFTFEGAQGAGLDPYHGVYPDITASRPMSRFINDSTYNIIMPEDIAMRVAVIKTTYMSSVGKRKLPKDDDPVYEQWIQKTFDEKGRSTGRLRDIYPISLPIGAYLKKAAGYDFLVATHLDAAKKESPIKVVTHYTNKKTKKETGYFPYQDALDTLMPHSVLFPSWDGNAIKGIKDVTALPIEARVFLSFLHQTIAPVILGTTDVPLGNVVSWLP